jgi:hypothetical protein
MENDQLCRVIAWALWIVSWGAFSLLVATWRLFLTNRYLKEATARERRSESCAKRLLIRLSYQRCNELQKTLLERFLRAPVRTLKELARLTDIELQQTDEPERPSATWEDEDSKTRHLTPR